MVNTHPLGGLTQRLLQGQRQAFECRFETRFWQFQGGHAVSFQAIKTSRIFEHGGVATGTHGGQYFFNRLRYIAVGLGGKAEQVFQCGLEVWLSGIKAGNGDGHVGTRVQVTKAGL